MLVIFQVAVGLIFIYSLFSILATSVNTLIANLLKLRARTLKRGLMQLLTDPEIQNDFLKHPLIRIIEPELEQVEVTRGSAQAAASASQQGGGGGVSYIRPEVFAKVLTDILTERAQLRLYAPLITAVTQLPASAHKKQLETLIYGAQNTGIGLSEIRAEAETLSNTQADVKMAIMRAISELEALHPAALTHGGSRLLPLLDGLRQVNDEGFQRALRVIVASANTLDEAQANMEQWFNAKMDQLTEGYKRYITYISFVIGLVLALALNADSLHMARALWEDPTLREAVVAAAQQQVDEGTPEVVVVPPAPETDEAGAEAEAEAETTLDDVIDSADAVAVALQDILTLNLPIGWEFRELPQCIVVAEGVRARECDDLRNVWLLGPANNPDYWLGIFARKLIGIFLTAVAVAQGAPFWFDLLNRLVRRN